jgi:hypothetical protein
MVDWDSSMFHELCTHIYTAVCVFTSVEVDVFNLWFLGKKSGLTRDLPPLERLFSCGMCTWRPCR